MSLAEVESTACERDVDQDSADGPRRSPSGTPLFRTTIVTTPVSEAATITVGQFESERRRTAVRCEDLQSILRRCDASETTQADPNYDPYLRVTGTGRFSGVCSVGALLPQFLALLRVVVALGTSFYWSYALAFRGGLATCGGVKLLPDVVYAVCILSQLVTSYVDSGTYEISALQLVLRRRMTEFGWYADLLSCVPGCTVEILFVKLVLRLRTLASMRHASGGASSVPDLPRCLQNWCPGSSIGNPLRTSLVRLLLSVYLFAHLLGCLFHAVVLSQQPDERQDELSAYLSAMKLCMGMMFSGNLQATVPEDQNAVIFYVLVMPLVIVFITTVSAEIILLAQRACVLESQQFERLAMVDEANKSLNLPLPLRRKILEYNLWLTRSFNISAYECLMRNSSRSAQMEVKLHLCMPFLSTAPFLQEAPPSFICDMLQSSVIQTVSAGDVIFNAGDPGLGMYCIIKGCCEVIALDGKHLSELSQGTYFGEIALISGSNRQATVVAGSFMLMVFFDRKSFQDIIGQYPEMLATFMSHCSQYSGNLLTQQFIDRLGFFKESPNRVTIIELLASRLTQRTAQPGEAIFEQGAQGDSMFFVFHGSLDVIRAGQGKVAELRDGAHFGELSLLSDVSERTATVTACTTSLLAELNRADFQEVMQDYPEDVMRLVVNAAHIQESNKRSEAKFRKSICALTAPRGGLSANVPGRTLTSALRTHQSLLGTPVIPEHVDLPGLLRDRHGHGKSASFARAATDPVCVKREQSSSSAPPATAIPLQPVPESDSTPGTGGYPDDTASPKLQSTQSDETSREDALLKTLQRHMWPELKSLVAAECERACQTSMKHCFQALHSPSPHSFVQQQHKVDQTASPRRARSW